MFSGIMPETDIAEPVLIKEDASMNAIRQFETFYLLKSAPELNSIPRLTLPDFNVSKERGYSAMLVL